MNMKIEYFDNIVNFYHDNINVIEIENKKYFYRFVNDLYSIVNNGYTDDISFFDETTEKNMNGKIKLFVDFFDFKFDSKKYTTDISKFVNESIDNENRDALSVLYNKIVKIYNKILNDVDLPLTVGNDISIETITKLVKVGIDSRNELLDNLFLLIDLEKTLKTNNLLVFVNLKQYLSKTELVELYKYSIYNNIFILLIDSQAYGGTLEYERKLIIDENLDEFVI